MSHYSAVERRFTRHEHHETVEVMTTGATDITAVASNPQAAGGRYVHSAA
jgi:hypothetical protein